MWNRQTIKNQFDELSMNKKGTLRKRRAEPLPTRMMTSGFRTMEPLRPPHILICSPIKTGFISCTSGSFAKTVNCAFFWEDVGESPRPKDFWKPRASCLLPASFERRWDTLNFDQTTFDSLLVCDNPNFMLTVIELCHTYTTADYFRSGASLSANFRRCSAKVSKHYAFKMNEE